MKGGKEKHLKIECSVNRKWVNLLRRKVLWKWHSDISKVPEWGSKSNMGAYGRALRIFRPCWGPAGICYRSTYLLSEVLIGQTVLRKESAGDKWGEWCFPEMHIPLLTVSLSPQHILVKQPCEGPVLSNSEHGGRGGWRWLQEGETPETQWVIGCCVVSLLNHPHHGQCKKLKKWGGALIC